MATGSKDMIKPPFKQGKNAEKTNPLPRNFLDFRDFREITWTSATSEKFPGSQGTGADGTECLSTREKKSGLAGFQTVFAMANAGPALMTTTPPRPGQNATYRAWLGPNESGE